MKLAVVASGWHYPSHFYREMAAQAAGAELFVVAHRSPELAIVRAEKGARLADGAGRLGALDRELYASYPTIAQLRSWGWHYQEEPNTVGDWGNLNQWLAGHDYRAYDWLLSVHDDTYLRNRQLLPRMAECDDQWLLLLGNGSYPEAPPAYVRGSLEFFRRELLDALGGRLDLGTPTLTRVGAVDSPPGMEDLFAWNDTVLPLREFMVQRDWVRRVAHLSPYYRVSAYALEGERGFLQAADGAPWSYAAGLEALLGEDEAMCPAGGSQ